MKFVVSPDLIRTGSRYSCSRSNPVALSILAQLPCSEDEIVTLHESTYGISVYADAGVSLTPGWIYVRGRFYEIPKNVQRFLDRLSDCDNPRRLRGITFELPIEEAP